MVEIKKFYLWLAGVFGGGLILALVVFLGIIPAVQNLNRPAYLEIMVLPVSARVEINGAEYTNAVYEMEPGSYTAKIELEGAKSEMAEFNLERGRTTGLYMNWSEEKGWQYWTAEELKHRNAISEIMPIYASICGTPASRVNCNAVKVQYDRAQECGNEECVVISGRGPELTDEVLDLVRGELSKRGYDLADYEYTYLQDINR